MLICSVENCTRQIAHKGLMLCNTHYQRFRRTGTIDDPKSRRNYCTVEDCGKPAHSYGLCAMHEKRMRVHGDLDTRLRKRDPGPAEERWLLKVDIQSPGCWIWTAGTTGKTGYGAYEGLTAHLWVYRHLVGPVLDGLHLDHLCRVRLCVNPDHLEPVTPQENIRRGAVGAGKERPKRNSFTEPDETIEETALAHVR